MDELNGVFLLSKNSSTTFMIKCMQMLLENFPRIKVTSIAYDELYFGYRVHFSSPKEDAVLMRKHLIVSGKKIRIVPLKTYLTIHGVRKNGGQQFESVLREMIENKFGKSLLFVNVPSTIMEITRNIRVCVNVPELEESEIFNHKGYPHMFICLPSYNEILRVTFHCISCKTDGHVRQNCPVLKLTKEKVTKKANVFIDSKNCNSDIANLFKTESPHAYAEKTGKEKTLKEGILRKGNLNYNEDKQGPSSISKKENKKVNFTPEKFLKINIEFGKNKNQTDEKNSKKLNYSPYSRHSDAFRSESKDDETNSYEDSDDDEMTFSERSDDDERNSYESSDDDKIYSDEDNNSYGQYFQEFSSSSHNTAGPSSRNIDAPPKRISAELQLKILSPFLWRYINMACAKFCILNSNELEAFLIKVKNRRNPAKFAKKYTKKVGKLKKQLQEIIKLYHKNLSKGTKEDKNFIKWLEGVVKRF